MHKTKDNVNPRFGLTKINVWVYDGYEKHTKSECYFGDQYFGKAKYCIENNINRFKETVFIFRR